MTSADLCGGVYCSLTAGDHQQIAMEKHAFEHGRVQTRPIAIDDVPTHSNACKHGDGLKNLALQDV